jgi:hypothetical protein
VQMGTGNICANGCWKQNCTIRNLHKIKIFVVGSFGATLARAVMGLLL